jgi:hypothetical protein
LIGEKCVVDKLMDGSVDNLMGNPKTGCPQVAAQPAHQLTHNGLFGFQQQIFYILFLVGSCLDRGDHNRLSSIVIPGARERAQVQSGT